MQSLITAFPAELREEARLVAALLPESRYDVGAFTVLVQGEPVTIPQRIDRPEPGYRQWADLTPLQQLLLHCLFTRHHDGRVRERHVKRLLDRPEPWVVPFVVQLVGEYVVEILTAIREGLDGRLVPGTEQHASYARFVAENPAFLATTERRSVSYWSAYYRRWGGQPRWYYPAYPDYPGAVLLGMLREAARA